MLGREPSDAAAAAALRGVRRQPVLPGAAGPRVRRRGAGRAAGDVSVSELQVPAMVVAALSEELALLSAEQPPGAARARRSPATRSSPSWPPPRPTSASRQAIEAVDELLERRPDPADHRAPALPLPPSDRPARRLRGLPGRLAHRRPRASRTGPRRPWRRRRWLAPTTSTPPPRSGDTAAVADPRRGRPAVRPARAGDGGAMVLRRAAPAAGDRAPPSNGSSCCSPAPRRWRRPAASPKRTRRSLESLGHRPPTRRVSTQSELVAACARVEHLLGRHEQAHARLTTRWTTCLTPPAPPRSSP